MWDGALQLQARWAHEATKLLRLGGVKVELVQRSRAVLIDPQLPRAEHMRAVSGSDD
jgi:hypothetical protein